MILVTGGAGFIGSNFVLDWLAAETSPLVNLDKLTYAGSLKCLAGVMSDVRHTFAHGDIGDRELVRQLLATHQPTAIVNFAAESHVDRSILGPAPFIETNVVGTFHLLEEARRYWEQLEPARKAVFRFLQVSTDEVFGSLGPNDPAFSETTPYAPNSPYSASKAASDHLVRAYHHTYGLPTLTTHCSNNYGPYQFPEKFIPLLILNATAGKALPIYGDGRNVRDWLYVTDHCAAIRRVLQHGRLGATYNIGGHAELRNIDVAESVCDLLDELSPRPGAAPRRSLITFVRDRPGHDRRYAMNTDCIRRELHWAPAETFASGLCRTVQWYLDNPAWTTAITDRSYAGWIAQQYGEGSVDPAQMVAG